jgi:hypothetical protein
MPKNFDAPTAKIIANRNHPDTRTAEAAPHRSCLCRAARRASGCPPGRSRSSLPDSRMPRTLSMPAGARPATGAVERHPADAFQEQRQHPALESLAVEELDLAGKVSRRRIIAGSRRCLQRRCDCSPRSRVLLRYVLPASIHGLNSSREPQPKSAHLNTQYSKRTSASCAHRRSGQPQPSASRVTRRRGEEKVSQSPRCGGAPDVHDALVTSAPGRLRADRATVAAIPATTGHDDRTAAR